MSADDGFLIRRNSRGKWIAQHYFTSAPWPPADERASWYETLEDCIAVYREAAKETEYGFNIWYGMPPDVPLMPAAMEEIAETFYSELEHLLNKYSKENGSETPDFVLAKYLQESLKLFDSVIRDRENWYGRTVPPRVTP